MRALRPCVLRCWGPDVQQSWLPILLGVVLVAGLGGLGYLGGRAWGKATQGARARKRLLRCANEHLTDVLLPDGIEGSLHVDYVLLTRFGILVVDFRDLQGVVFAAERMEEWAVMDGSRRSSLRNPLGGLYDRVQSVRQICPEIPVDGRVVTTRAQFPRGRPDLVMPLDDLVKELGFVKRKEQAPELSALRPAWERLVAATTPNPLGARKKLRRL